MIWRPSVRKAAIFPRKEEKSNFFIPTVTLFILHISGYFSMFFTFVFSPRKVFEICSFINSQCLSMAETIISLSLVLSSDSAISTHFCPFYSIHIFAMERICRVPFLNTCTWRRLSLISVGMETNKNIFKKANCPIKYRLRYIIFVYRDKDKGNPFNDRKNSAFSHRLIAFFISYNPACREMAKRRSCQRWIGLNNLFWLDNMNGGSRLRAAILLFRKRYLLWFFIIIKKLILFLRKRIKSKSAHLFKKEKS